MLGKIRSMLAELLTTLAIIVVFSILFSLAVAMRMRVESDARRSE